MEAQPLAWTPTQVQTFWDYWAGRPEQHAHYFSGQVGKGVCKFLEHSGSLAGLRVLDFGAGPGYLVEQLVQRGAHVSAVEYSERGVAGLNQRFHRDRFWDGAKLYDGTQLPWDNDRFDLICCLETIEHLLNQDLNVVLRDLRRVLRPGGTLLLTTPNSENLREQTVFCPQCACEFHRWQHVRRWTPESLSGHLASLGFSIEFCEGLSFHEFQPGRPELKDFTRFRAWRNVVASSAQLMLDGISPLPFPKGRRFRAQLRRGGLQHLAAVVSKPSSADANVTGAPRGSAAAA